MPTISEKLYVILTAKTARFARGMKKATRHVRSFSKSVFRAATSMRGLLGTAVGLYALQRAFRAVASATAEFGERMAFVSTMLTDKTMPLLVGMRREILDLSMKWGESTTSIARGLYDILSAAIPADKAMAVLETSIRAARGGFTTTAVAADALTTMINAYVRSADDATAISDMMFATVKRGKLIYEDLAQSMGTVASSAALAGLRTEELFAAMATMTRGGIRAEEASTALATALLSFLKPMETAKVVAAKYGIVLSAQTLRTKGLIGALRQLMTASAEDVAVITGRIRAYKALARLLQDIEGYQYDVTLMTNSAGLAAEATAKATDTLAFAWERVKASLQVAAIEIGTAYANVIDLKTRMLDLADVMRNQMFDAIILSVEALAKLAQALQVVLHRLLLWKLYTKKWEQFGLSAFGAPVLFHKPQQDLEKFNKELLELEDRIVALDPVSNKWGKNFVANLKRARAHANALAEALRNAQADPAVTPGGRTGANAIIEMSEAADKYIKRLRLQIDTYGWAARKAKLYELALDGMADAQFGVLVGLSRELDLLDKAAAQKKRMAKLAKEPVRMSAAMVAGSAAEISARIRFKFGADSSDVWKKMLREEEELNAKQDDILRELRAIRVQSQPITMEIP